MSEIKGNKYKLAGFDVSQKGTLVDVFAKFCGVDEDPANLPQTRISKMFGDTEPMEMHIIYPSLSVGQIVETLVGKNDIARKPRELHLGTPPSELLADLGEEQFARVLIEMGKAKKAYLAGDPVSTFVPVVK